MSTRGSALEREAQKSGWDKFISAAALAVAFPAIYSGLGLVSERLYTFDWRLCVSAWAVVVVLNVVTWCRIGPSDQSFLEVLRDNEHAHIALEEHRGEISKLQSSIVILSSQCTYSLSNWEMIAEYAQRDYVNTDDLRTAVDLIASPLYLQCGQIFGIGASERWNFAVYIYSLEEDELKPIWREKARNHPSVGIGRSWGRGQGHVGKCLVDKRSIITRDATHPDALPLSAVSEDRRLSYDEEVYRSFAAFPIGPVSDQGLPLGVLVATSDCVGRFDLENTAILAHAAGVIGSLMMLAHIDYDELKSADSKPPAVGSGDPLGEEAQ